jgi:hypothetical protein
MLTVIAPAASSDLTTRATVKAELQIAGGGDDDFLSSAITRASAAVSRWCNRVFPLETVRETFRLDRTRPELVLSRFPVVSIASVTVDGTALDPAADFEADGDRGILYRLDSRGKFMCWPSAVVVVEYSAGFLLPGDPNRTLPDDIERAALLLVKAEYFARIRDPLVKSEDVSGALSTSFWVGGFGNGASLPPDVEGFLTPHRNPAMG